MTESDSSGRRTLRRLALLCVVLLLATTSLSAFMRLSQSGLGCAEGPACYGAQLRELQLGIGVHAPVPTAIELARLLHRVVATLALVLVAAMVVLARNARPAIAGAATLANTLLALALGLAVLGVATPGARLPVVAMGNLLGGLAMLALCWRLVGRLASDRAVTAATAQTGLGPWATAGIALVAAQVVSGALVSASYSALSCSGLGECLQNAQATGWDLRSLNPWHEPRFDASLAPVHPAGAPVQLLHRAGAAVLLPVLVLLAIAAWWRGRQRAALAVLGLTLVQLALGLAMVTLGMPLPLVLLHNAVAALLLAVLVRLV